MLGEHAHAALPMSRVIALELEILGSHGAQAHRYEAMMAMIEHGKLQPQRLLGAEISLNEAPAALMAMDRFESHGITTITRF